MDDAGITEILGKMPIMADLPSWQLEAVGELAESLKLKKGARLIERGSDDGFTYFLTAGKVSLVDADGSSMIIDADTESVRTPLANLRPRIVDVTTLGRVQAIRVPDILLSSPKCSDIATSRNEATVEKRAQAKPPRIATQLPFTLYREIRDSKSSMLPSLPDTAVRIQLAIEDDRSNAEEVARLVETDPAMAAKLIMTANSALYGGQASIVTCTAAVVRLGLQVTRKLVLTFSLKEVFRTNNKLLRQRMKSLWEHSVSIAATSFVLASEVDGMNPEEVLLAGLVHDIGAIAVINHATRYPRLASNQANLERAISCLCGELSALILREWKFVPAVVLAARDAEFWQRKHNGDADLTDILIVAQVHDRLRRNEINDIPPIADIPAFAKVLGEDASPHKSITILNRAQTLVDEMRRVLHR